MNIYRASYCQHSGSLSPKRITFAAADATAAHMIAGWFEQPSESLLTVKLLRQGAQQLDIDLTEAED